MSTDPLEWTNKATKRRGLTSWYQGQRFVLNVAPTPSGKWPQTHWAKHFLCRARSYTAKIVLLIVCYDLIVITVELTTQFYSHLPFNGLDGLWTYYFVLIFKWCKYNFSFLIKTFDVSLLMYGSCSIIAFTANLSESAAVRKWGYTTWNSNYKTSGAFNLLLISQQLWWKARSPINVSKYDPTMSWPSHNPINIT